MIRLLIDGNPCEFELEPKIILDYCSSDLSDVESGRKGKHIVVSVPSTILNDTLLGYGADPENTDRFNAEYHVASIEADGAEVQQWRSSCS